MGRANPENPKMRHAVWEFGGFLPGRLTGFQLDPVSSPVYHG